MTEVHPPLSPVFETFDTPSPRNVSFSFEARVPPLRYWFLTAESTRLLQVQHDRFVLNWRKLETEEKYPHYDNLNSLLTEEFDRFESFLLDEGLSPPAPDQVELTYVNHLPAGPPKARRQPLQGMVRLWSGQPTGVELPEPDEVALSASYLMRSEDKPRGRLHINLESRYRIADTAPLYVLNLLARGAPDGPGLAGAMSAMDRGHEWIVQNFAAITTEEMHKIWERTR